MTLFRWDVKYDRNGFRNDVDLNRADIIVIGDSFVEGMTVPAPQLMTSLLAQLQGKVVANLGQMDYGPIQELVVLKRYGLPLRPHTVVWMFYEGNDLLDVTNYHQRMSASQPPQKPKPPPGFWSAFWERSFTRNAYRQLQKQYRRFLRPSGVKHAGIIRTTNGQKLTVYFFSPSHTLSESELGALDETVRIVQTAQQLSAAQGARLLFVFAPTAFRVLHALCQFPPESECRNWVLSDLPERLKSAVGAISPDMGYLDLTPYLTDAAKSGVLPYYADDDHWTPAGQKIAAEAVNNYLQTVAKRGLRAAW